MREVQNKLRRNVNQLQVENNKLSAENTLLEGEVSKYVILLFWRLFCCCFCEIIRSSYAIMLLQAKRTGGSTPIDYGRAREQRKSACHPRQGK